MCDKEQTKAAQGPHNRAYTGEGRLGTPVMQMGLGLDACAGTAGPEQSSGQGGGMHVFASGAKSSVEKPRYDLVPLAGITLAAQRFAYGAGRHGARNYEKGFRDTTFIRDRENHLFEHVQKYLAGERTDENLGAILCNAMMLARLRELAADAQRQTVESFREQGAMLRHQADVYDREADRLASADPGRSE